MSNKNLPITSSFGSVDPAPASDELSIENLVIYCAMSLSECSIVCVPYLHSEI